MEKILYAMTRILYSYTKVPIKTGNDALQSLVILPSIANFILTLGIELI